ncbi:hypothetical protein HY572_04330 [Candidatus Micrarchaeota archaeon]|nr:hypothetical protein [Candidatus Micrarchaeota archaeon]
MHEAVACEISTPAYVSFHTALHLHGLTTQPHRTIQLAVTRNAKKYQVLGTPVQEYRVPKNQFRAYEKKDNLFLATPEKAVADAISIPKSCPAAIIMEALAHVKAGKIPPYLSSAAANKRLKNLMRHA